MKIIQFTIDTNYKENKSNRYNFSEEERDTAIKDLQNNIKKEMVMNNIKEINSWKLANEFICK